MPYPLFTYSDVWYTVWFVVTILWVTTILVVGVLMATGKKVSRHREK